MIVCGVCKQSKDVKNKWLVREHSIDKKVMRDFRLCDDCATSLIRKIAAKIDDIQKDGEKIYLTHNTLLNSFALDEEDNLEVVLSMDLAKARKLVLEETGEI